jgi:hypothetical protein
VRENKNSYKDYTVGALVLIAIYALILCLAYSELVQK